MTALANSIDLGIAIEDLIRAKNRRDNDNFTTYKLAKCINVDRSLIRRLLNGDVTNPRIDTLLKITTFFINEGFSISLDDLVQWGNNVSKIDERIILEDKPKDLPLYQMENFDGERIGMVSISVPKSSPGTIAFLSHEHLEPVFNPGSIFVVDLIKKPEHNNLVVLRQHGSKKVIIKKYLIHKGSNSPWLISLDGSEKMELTPEAPYQIIGIVIRVNVKT